MIFKIHEIIKSTIQGEGYNWGMPIDLVRLYGCPVGCSFCDTGYSSEDDYGKNINYKKMDFENILGEINSKNILISGGEPFINKSLNYLCSELEANGHRVFLETSGSFWKELPDNSWITLSPKEHLNSKFKVDKRFWERADEIKLVISSEKDFKYYQSHLSNIQNSSTPKMIFLQPEWSVKDQIMPYLVELLNQNPNYRLSIQGHKLLNLK